jgi:PAS domain S-box-containing protein
MIVADRDGQMQVVNSETERIFGYRREELVGQPVAVLLPSRVTGADPSHRADRMHAPAAGLTRYAQAAGTSTRG